MNKKIGFVFVVFILFSSNALALTEKEIECLMKAMYGEARGESDKGRLLVAGSVLTRKSLGYTPGSICGIVNQSYAPKAVPAKHRKHYRALALKAKINGVTHFHSYKSRNNKNAKSFTSCPFNGKIGSHWTFSCGRSRRADVVDTATPGAQEFDVADIPMEKATTATTTIF